MDLNKVFYPKSIAIVGASTRPDTVGNDVVKNLATQGYDGEVFPVNPKAEELFGLKCYPNLTAVGKAVDLMVIIVPAASVPTVLLEGAKLGIKGAIIISAGFKEVGRKDLEDEIEKICIAFDIALIGPNCLGVINPEIKMNASFAAIQPAAGEVAFISQSGALCSAVLDYAPKLGLGFSKFMSIGNKAVIDELVVLDYLANDEKTKVIALYAEQLEKSEELINLIKKITRGPKAKPIIFLKSGRTSAGASASASHTGALAGNDSAYEALFSQSGAIRALTINELFNYIQVFTNNPLNATKNIAIITNAGGPGVIAADEIISNRLNLAAIGKEAQEELKKILPPAANTHNPIDLLGDAPAERFAKSLEIVAADKNVDAIITVLTPQSMTEVEATANDLVSIKRKCSKPIVASFMGDVSIKAGVEILKAGKVANFEFPEEAIRALAVMDRFNINKDKKEEVRFEFLDVQKEKVKASFSRAKASGDNKFPENRALEILSFYNFPVLNSVIVDSPTAALKAAAQMGTRIAMKIVSPDILHKTDVGGVLLDVAPEEAGKKYTEIMDRVARNKPEAELTGVLITEMISHGADMILGSAKDPNLGNTIMVGLGGIYVEILKDVVFGLAPISREDAINMVNLIKAKEILTGARGFEPLDIEALVECLGRLSQLVTDFPEIKELDINPLRVLPKGQGVRILDARLVI